MSKNLDQFLNDLAGRESGGNYKAVNRYGFLGKYQMGEKALIDAGYYKGDDTKSEKYNDWKGEWTGKDGIKSKEDFLNSPQAQENAIREYMRKQWRYIERLGLDKYIGKEIDGIVITESGLLAGAHLKGVGSLKKFLESGGKGSFKDGFGTDIREYLSRFAGYDISPIIGKANSNSSSPSDTPHTHTVRPVDTPSFYTHTVQPGDTLSKIAKRYNVSLNDLLKANPWIKNPDYIQVGWKIKIPGYAEKVRRNLREGTRRIDPLVIDLDGDGIELTDIKESTAMFDLTGSGFANKVGWVSPDDGFLVWDRNGNGRIDDISEMFGNEKDSGFKALALYDTNRDGKIDAFDEVFKNLKVWQDKNGDGRTDEGELMSLSDVGIKAINLNTTHTNINQGGNQITEVGTVEFEDGRKTQAGNVHFEIDRLYSYYNREVKLNPEIIGLPWIKGYGFMPDLPVAMSLDETLLNMVKDAVAEPDLTKLKERFEKIIFRWAGVENVTAEELGLNLFWINIDKTNRVVRFDNRVVMSFEQLGAIAKFTGESYQELRQRGNSLDGEKLLFAWKTMFQGLFTRFVVDAGLLEDILPAYYDFYTDRIIMDESFDSQSFNVQIKQMLSSDDINQSTLAIISLMVLKEVNALDENFIKDLITDVSILPKFINNPYADFLVKAISGTEGNDWLYGSNSKDLILGKAGNDYLYGYSGDDILVGGAGDDRLYGYDGDDVLVGGEGNDYMEGGSGSDVYVFNKGDGKDTVYDYSDKEINTIVFGDGIDKDSVEFLKDGSDLVIKVKGTDDSLRIKYWFSWDSYSKFQFKFSDGTVFTKADIDSKGYIVEGTEGNDWLYGSNSKDLILGKAGNDYLYGYGGDDILVGGAGNDRLYGYDGNDVLASGEGSDYMEGGSGSDVYMFNKGDGKDTVYDYSNSDKEINTIVFGEGINKDDVEFLKDGSDLVVRLKDTEDSIRINYWFWSDNYSRFQFKFTDGTIFSKADIDSKGYIVEGTEGNDWLYGSNSKDLILGKAGNDYLYGYGGDDILVGGAGNDRLYGYDGNDVLASGEGSDYMEGGSGSDVYVFNKGDGKDTVYDYSDKEINTIVFGDGIDKDSVEFLKDGSDLVIKVKGTDDSLRIKYWFSWDSYSKFQFKFSDGIERIQVKDGYYITRWDIENIVNAMIDFNSDKGMDYMQKYNELINNQQYMTLLSGSWYNTSSLFSIT